MDRIGRIIGLKTVVESPSGEIYFLRQAVAEGNGKAVMFDLEEDSKNYVDILAIDEPLRPYFAQRAPKDCALAAVRMAFATVAEEDLGHDRVKQAFKDAGEYDTDLGANWTGIPKVMNKLFSDGGFLRNSVNAAAKLTKGKLAEAVKAKRPAIAQLKNPSHVVVVDSVEVGDHPITDLRYRDPASGPLRFQKNAEGEEQGEFGVRATGWFYTMK